MKAESNRITRANIHRVEAGDRLHLHATESHRDDWEGPREFDITVSRTILRSRFGPRIISVENIPTGHDPKEYPEIAFDNDWYLEDDWRITILPDSPTGDASENDQTGLPAGSVKA